MVNPLDNSRSLYQHLYYDKREVQLVANAIGIDERSLLVKCAEADRILYHSCINNLLLHRRYEGSEGSSKGIQIARDTDRIYNGVLKKFHERMPEVKKKLEKGVKEIDEFVDNIANSVSEGPINKRIYDYKWSTDAVEKKTWIKHAVETFEIVHNRIANGEYTPPSPDWDAASITKFYCKCALEYKLFRKEARKLVESYMDEIKHELGGEPLTHKKATEHCCVAMTGSIASGKTILTEAFLNSLKPKEKNCFLVMDADDLK